jgi:hypothetical protein
MRNCGLFYAPLAAILRKVESDCSCFVLRCLQVHPVAGLLISLRLAAVGYHFRKLTEGLNG